MPGAIRNGAVIAESAGCQIVEGNGLGFLDSRLRGNDEAQLDEVP